MAGRESDEAVGAVAQHATVPSQSETREAVGATVRLFSMQLYPVRVEMRDEAVGAVARVQQYPGSVPQ
jgi:hypothetical protein